jgi:flagellar hook assembly protein FlgD
MTIRPVPTECTLSQNYPNPFNHATTIQYTVGNGQSPSRISLKIFNLLGQEVRTLVDESQEPGYYTEIWDGTYSDGTLAVTGVYFYRLTVDDGQWSKTMRMVLMK